jgi:HTH-type transcriptional regulator/antitoxin HigA
MTFQRKMAGQRQTDGYFALVEEFPLVHIRDDRHLKAASAMIDRLLRMELDSGQEAYLDVLTDLVEAYEAKHHPIPDASEADVLRELMNANRLSQSALARAVGISQSTISAVLNDPRSLTKAQVESLARSFRVWPSVFFPA